MNDFWGIFLCVRDTYTRSKAKNYNNNNSKLTIIAGWEAITIDFGSWILLS